MFQGLHLSIKGFTYLLRNSLNFLRFKGENLRDLIGPLKVATNWHTFSLAIIEVDLH